MIELISQWVFLGVIGVVVGEMTSFYLKNKEFLYEPDVWLVMMLLGPITLIVSITSLVYTLILVFSTKDKDA